MDGWMVEVFLSRFVLILADSKDRRLFITDGFSCYFSLMKSNQKSRKS